MTATVWLACNVTQAAGMTGSAGRFASPAPQAPPVASATIPPVAWEPPNDFEVSPPSAVTPPAVELLKIDDWPPTLVRPAAPAIPPAETGCGDGCAPLQPPIRMTDAEAGKPNDRRNK